ncbi:MAG: HAMP domain-containing sensor histidine kinase [Novosphingobium sp.]|nr:HAMP domain-containing sensor histidine kinase [Novosphingobium sp.]
MARLFDRDLIPLRSTTLRLAILVFLLQSVSAAALLFGLGAVIRQQSRAEALDVAETLRDDLLAVLPRTGKAEARNQALGRAIVERLARGPSHGMVLALVDARGRIMAGNIAGPFPPPQSGNAPLTVDVLRIGHAEPETTLIAPRRLAGNGMLIAGTVIETEQQFLAIVERASLAALVMAIVLAAMAALLAARQISGRLQATIVTLGGVGNGDLSRRVPPDASGDAFAVLGREVNEALDRVASLNAELKFATDLLAHDLKSPLTRLTSALDRAAAQSGNADAGDAVEQARAEAGRVLSIIDTALSISRAEGGLGRDRFRDADVSQMLEAIGEIYAPAIEDEQRRLTIVAPPSLVMPVHRQLLNQAVGNLIDNTIKYGAGPVELTLERQAGMASLSVSDQGPGIPAQLREKALSRFGRLSEARGGWGAGLGLSLVQAVAHLHGGSVILSEGPQGRGLKVTLCLPLPQLP